MREEIERLMRRVYETNAEITALFDVGTRETDTRLDTVMWPLVDGLREELLALEPSWPAEWRPVLTAWCEGWSERRDLSGAGGDMDSDPSDCAAEEIGLLFGMPGAPELRARRDASRARRAEMNRGFGAMARETAREYVALFGHASDEERERWGEAGAAADMRRLALVRMAVETRVRCVVGNQGDPLTRPLLETADALLMMVERNERGRDAGAIWERIEELMGALTRVMEKAEAAEGALPN